jgi:hypothetical protein
MRFAMSKLAKDNEMKWTEQELDLLKQMYREGALLTKMSEVFGRSGSAVQDKARRQRLNRPRKVRKDGKQWTAGIAAPNAAFVAEMAPQKPGEVQVEIFPRTWNPLLDPPGLDACNKRGLY